jgi:hypothetical protein
MGELAFDTCPATGEDGDGLVQRVAVKFGNNSEC